VITEDELAAIAAALATINEPAEAAPAPAASRWKVAAREPEFEIEDYRGVH
jgi:hypothetical protein